MNKPENSLSKCEKSGRSCVRFPAFPRWGAWFPGPYTSAPANWGPSSSSKKERTSALLPQYRTMYLLPGEEMGRRHPLYLGGSPINGFDAVPGGRDGRLLIRHLLGRGVLIDGHRQGAVLRVIARRLNGHGEHGRSEGHRLKPISGFKLGNKVLRRGDGFLLWLFLLRFAGTGGALPFFLGRGGAGRAALAGRGRLRGPGWSTRSATGPGQANKRMAKRFITILLAGEFPLLE